MERIRVRVRLTEGGGGVAATFEGQDIRLDDTALGVGLVDRLRALLPGEDLSCDLVVEGTWGPLVGVPGFLPGEESGPRVFAVRRVLGRPGEDEAS